MTKSTTKTRVFPIVLKTIIDDAMREKTIVDANERAIATTQHVKNTSHVARNQREYDALRCAFDNVYATKIDASRKRATSSRKRNTTSNDVVTTNDTND